MLKISPSKAASYFYHECERYLYLNALPKKERTALGVTEQVTISSPVLTGGANWEEEVVKIHLKDKIKIPEMDMEKIPLSDRFFTPEAFVEWLKNPIEKYIYQPTMTVPESFYTLYNIDPTKLMFSNCRPDLIECIKTKEERIFRIIDIKSSNALKVSHKVQVSFYALILDTLLKVHDIEGRVDFSQAGVWIYKQEQPEVLSIENIVPYLTHFMSHTLHDIAVTKFEDLFWHLEFKCEWCSFFDFCLSKAKEKNHISLLPYLSNQAGRYIKENKIPYSLNDMADFIKGDENRSVLEKSFSLKQRLKRLHTQLDSFASGEVLSYNSYSSSMPFNESIQLILTVQKDQVSGEIFACSIYRLKGMELFGTGSELKHFTAAKFDECEQGKRDFVDHLYTILSMIHHYNHGKQWSDQLSVQTYVTDNYEFSNLIEILQGLLTINDYREKAMNLLFHFHSDVLSQSDEHPENVVPFPVIILTSTVSRLFAVPAEVALKLEDLSLYVGSKGAFKYQYQRKDYLANRLSNVMKSDLIYQVWEKEESEKLEWIESDLKGRLYLASSVIDGIRNLAKDDKGNSFLFAWPEKFQFPVPYHYKNEIVSKLAFMTQYESTLAYLDIRERRSKSLDERLTDGDSLRLKYIGEKKFELLNKEVLFDINFSEAWVLTEDNHFGEQQQLKFKDYPYRNKFYAPKNLELYLASIGEHRHEDDRVILELEIVGKVNKFDLIPERNYLLSVRFTDWTSGRVLNGLGAIDAGNDVMLKLLQNPNGYRKKFKANWEEKVVDTLIKQSGLTPSQSKAFRSFLNYTLTGVWGPPGSGKTHFIATALLLLIKIYEKRGKRLKILISGFTHNAIENALVKIHQQMTMENVKIGKLKKIQTEKARVVEEVDDRQISHWLNDDKHVILGGTLYNTQKVYDNGWLAEKFNVVVVDEASQVKTADSLLALAHVSPKGRIMIVGDHYQLPPIIQGEYLSNDGELNVYDSIFQLMIDQDPKQEMISKLEDNFRMNEVLCRYPAEKIYGPNYTAFNTEISTQKISLQPLETEVEEWVKKVVDPDYPLVLCLYNGVQETQENQCEADWVAAITKVLRANLLNGIKEVYEDSISGDRDFWKEGLFIISPHNAQNRLIRSTLEKEGLRPDFFVGTVDKMQGQESAAAIISYGVSDLELAIKEGEFLYSLNRLNVSLTRGQKKTIVFLSRKLISPSLEVLGNEDYSNGVDFMINLENYAKVNGELETIDHNGIAMDVYRVKS
ncbi:bifunctional RecB family nuclease/DEAD/DEAH box helicase [Evansella tamaricis]|uniref:AAA family ATPase n=1 Tax=Evansella tamaricis TaxID=2069301 RepID=A0ABS6JEE1_9BACI|nr:AAA domain-containing protein [Evansella tamaricis]MBU9711217.1 AAA family ATPase [Evansella tamaricis]